MLRRLMGVALIAWLLVGAGGGEAGATSIAGSSRFAGADRYATAALLAKSTFVDGADSAVVASGANYPDALAAAYLAGQISGPILLTDPNSASPSMLDALAALKVKHVYVVGGTAAVSSTVQSTIAATTTTNSAGGPIAVTRLSGPTRYDTDKAIAEAGGAQAVGGVGGKQTAIIASATSFPDALAAGPVAYGLILPVVLATSTALTPQGLQILGDLHIKQVIIMGGDMSVSPLVEGQMAALGISTLFRAAGADRYDTAAKFATYATKQLNLTAAKTAVATGLTFPDALAAGPFAGANLEPILLMDGVPAPTNDYVIGQASSLTHIDALGGSNAITDGDIEALETDAGAANAGPPGQTFHLGDANTGTQVAAHVGDTVQVNLTDAFDGGFQWTITQAPAAAVLTLASEQSVVRGSPVGFVGAGGTEAFNFAVVGTGTTSVTLSYAQGSSPPTATYQFSVQIS